MYLRAFLLFERVGIVYYKRIHKTSEMRTKHAYGDILSIFYSPKEDDGH